MLYTCIFDSYSNLDCGIYVYWCLCGAIQPWMCLSWGLEFLFIYKNNWTYSM